MLTFLSRRVRCWRVPAVLLLLALVAPAAAHSPERHLEPFRLQLKWVPQAQFMGYYVALAEGYYERAGLEVEIVPGAPGIDPSRELVDGDVDAAVEWFPAAIRARENGLPVINVAQIFQLSGLTLTCRHDRGIAIPEDLRGRTAAVAGGGNEVPLEAWTTALGIPIGSGPESLAVVPYHGDISLYRDGDVDCIQAMTYNEHWKLLMLGEHVADMTAFRYEDFGFALLEDGLYVDERRLADPVFRDRLVRFVRASLSGWQRAAQRPRQAALIVTQLAPGTTLEMQTHMAEEVAKLVGPPESVGLLDLADFDRTVGLLESALDRQLDDTAEAAWTHDIWDEAVAEYPGLFSRQTHYRLGGVLASGWFYGLDLIGTVAFAIAGFMRAKERRYDLWGAFILTLLPAVGGGTLRDLLVGGDRHPPFIFKDPIYVYIVFAVVILGSLASRFAFFPRVLRRQFDTVLLLTDTIGLAAFTVIGAKVAIVANLEWFWVPVCAALTCAGGGMLLDIVTGREPRTFKGEPYEECAIAGGLLMIALLAFADAVPFVTDYIVGTILVVLVFVFCLRMAVVKTGFRMPLLGTPRALR